MNNPKEVALVKDEVEGDVQIRDVIEKLPKLNQRQYSTNAQLIQLMDVARKLGLYDAQDLIKKILK
jgi:hypothetical protein